MSLVQSRSLADQINDLLLEWIMDSRFKPGQRLNETALAEELGVSRTPVREALKRLAANGFLTVIPRKGVFVNDIIDIGRLEEILDLRYLLEMYAAERVDEHISEEHLSKMHSLIEECESIVNSDVGRGYRRYIDIDCALHRLIITSGGNGLLGEFYETLAVFLQIAKVRLSQSTLDMSKGHKEHKAIVEACEARNRDRLLKILGSHLRRSRDELLELARSPAGTK